MRVQMLPEPGERFVRHVGDWLSVTVRAEPGVVPTAGWRARLRTNLGRAEGVNREIVQSRTERLPLAGASWRDVSMRRDGDHWRLSIPLTEVGFFRAKAYLVDDRGFQHWPEGSDIAVSVHPSWTRAGNTVYCAFPRMFGDGKERVTTADPKREPMEKALDEAGYTVIPPSGKLRDVQRQLPHIVERLGCRIIHLLPVSPTPTTFARFGRYGSPYAVQDLVGIDPALVEFDKRTTGVDQFRELAYDIHSRGARLFLDLVINHTGWGSREWTEHPEWFVRTAQGEFECPGAWGVVWEDLVELDQGHLELWDYLAETFLTWCRRGVDGFRCDAGYKIPAHVWQYIVARVRQEFPDTVFFLEGLGGPWDATESLLQHGGMQWAYSELFQNFGPASVAGYLDHAFRTSARVGTLIHYSETHDNPRLASVARGREWSLHRNLLCALTSVQGGFGFTCGVEWCASERINVHSNRGLAWGNPNNLVAELSWINRLICEHPAFFDGARCERLSGPEAEVYVMRRMPANGADTVLVLANHDFDAPRSARLPTRLWRELGEPAFDLAQLGAPRVLEWDERKEAVEFLRRGPVLPTGSRMEAPLWRRSSDGGRAVLGRRDAVRDEVELLLSPGAVVCLAVSQHPTGLSGAEYRRLRELADWGLSAQVAGARWVGWPEDELELHATRDWRWFADAVEGGVEAFLSAAVGATGKYHPVIRWGEADSRRVVQIPSGHWLLVWDEVPFRARLSDTVANAGGGSVETATSVSTRRGTLAVFPPRNRRGDFLLELERYGRGENRRSGRVVFLDDPLASGAAGGKRTRELGKSWEGEWGPMLLLTNGRGGMSRMAVDLGRVFSKYDCLLGANLHESVPVDRHIFAKRVRVWVNAEGFITPLNGDNLVSFDPGPPGHWRFVVNAGDGRCVEIHLIADLLPDRNTMVLRFVRPESGEHEARYGRPLGPQCRVNLTVRVDIEDRNFHWTTKFSEGARSHFENNTQTVGENSGDGCTRIGFVFRPAPDRQLQVVAWTGDYHTQGEWSFGTPHPIEGTRGMDASGDSYSPGWFDLPLTRGGALHVAVCAERESLCESDVADFVSARLKKCGETLARISGENPSVGSEGAQTTIDGLSRRLALSCQAFVVRRGRGTSVIAGYPWFLDWGRDTLIAARGLLAAGMVSEVDGILSEYGGFEDRGTLPNSIFGENASNRDTSDAPLWFGMVCEERAAWGDAGGGEAFYQRVVGRPGRTIAAVLRSIACGYLAGTSNGIRVDAASGLVGSPSHFTWMDTNHPAATPREGYPVEIQALWIRLLRQLARLRAEPWEGRGESWADLARRAERSVEQYYWLEEAGWYADCLLAAPGHPARTARPDHALRSNALWLVALDLVSGERAQRLVRAAIHHLLVPGAVRSLAPLPVIPPLPVVHHGRLLNDPDRPYWGRYEGDEDTRRKPAYHNGTAWVWTLPALCEALVKAFPGEAWAEQAARSYLAGAGALMDSGCLGHLPEIIDGDAPHTARGCDAQAWSVSEALRVWRWLMARR